ncbi:carbohydrate sulfotransferase 1-like [Asterias rubens]|uniref:carbohydrate sulfotransferase 1-like n=1 Tax=Asterias rubens TaxID=7604 RepID=UPI0014554DD6|nr:carbohydrate sulfotransferase 1-like [Asterias rubens]
MNRTTMARRNRLIVYSVLFSSSLLFIILQLNYVDYKQFFRAKSKTLRESMFWEINEYQELLLLHPDRDESNILSGSDYFRKSQTTSRSYSKTKTRKQPVLQLKGSVSKSRVETSDVQTLLEYKIRDMQIEQPTNKKVSGDLMGSIEEHYFEAIVPKLESTALRQGRVMVLIVTNRRSGSSFLGQFFNQNPDTFFQFEPLKLTEWKKEVYPNMTDYLHRLVKCEFNKTPYLVDFLNMESLHRASSRIMIEPPLCNATFKSAILRSMVKKRCPPLQLLPLTQACRKKQYYTAKLIRLYSISSLESLAYDPEINLKIIHLVRDPRGTYTSRSRLKSSNISLELGKTLDGGISYLCKRIKQNLEFIRSQPAWIQGKYKLVRYEDIAHNPMELAQEIYDFTGMGPLPNSVQQWILNNTKSMVKPSDKSANTYYSTSRDASKVSEAWRYHVPYKVALRMQDLCRETLRELGYVEVKTEQELLDKNNSLVTRHI